MGATARMEFRVTPSDRARILYAAELAGEPPSTFARNAAEERANQVLRDHDARTHVPAEFFDELQAALDAPAQANAGLSEAFARLREMTGD
jgi:uncharacterized protein (DUF1778 family)